MYKGSSVNKVEIYKGSSVNKVESYKGVVQFMQVVSSNYVLEVVFPQLYCVLAKAAGLHCVVSPPFICVLT